MLAGCGGSQPPIGATSVFPSNGQAESSSRDPWLYVGGSNNVVNAYDVAQPGEPLVLSITQGIDNPAGLKVDDQGTLYVASPGNGTVAEYPFGQNVPAVTLSVSSAVDTAIDPRTGDLYVDTRANPPGIFIYKRGHTQPSRYILSKLFVDPSQILFDSSGTLYIADNQTGVSVIKPGTHRVVSLNLQNLDGCATGIALDEHTSQLYVSACSVGLQVYKLGNEYPIRNLVDGFSADYLAIGVVGKREDLFAPDVGSDTVYVYHDNRVRSFEVITTGSQNALGVAIKPAGAPR
jgi:hypothetical protein